MFAGARFSLMAGFAGLTMMSAAALPPSASLAADIAMPLFGTAAINQSGIDQSGIDRFDLDQPAGDQAGISQPGIMQSAISQPGIVQPAIETLAALVEPDAAEVECMAKVVMHEAGNQPYDGKVAVAQTLVNRKADGRFGGTICEVVNQHGQFFSTAAYNPNRDGDTWNAAVKVARAVLSGGPDAVAPGAMFFRAAYTPASSFFRSRKQVASVGAHIFYR